MGWSVQNLGAEPLALDAAWLPHGQFRGERTDLRSSPTLEPGEATEVELPVRWRELPSIVENAFLILTVRWRGEPWRILARVTVGVDAEGAPDAQTQNMTIQQIGFSHSPSIE